MSALSAGEIQANYLDVLARVQQAAERAGRDPSSVTLIAVSKTHPASHVLAAAQAGAQHFGENRVEEGVEKIPQVMGQLAWQPPTWHMIGHVQSRKGREVGALFDVVHSLDSLKLARKLTEGVPDGRRLPVYIEVNVSGEASKEGFQMAGWEQDAALVQRFSDEVRALLALDRLQPVGLMTMAPIVDEMEATRPVFRSLRLLRDTVQETSGVHLPGLSMGMTDDFPVAIEEGATIVRVGRAIFGDRAPRI